MWINCMGGQLYIFAISLNTRCAGTQRLQLHDILPLPLRQEGIHNDCHPRCIWCIRGHSCTGSQFFGILLDESIILLANSSLASALTASISLYSCLLQSIQLQLGSSLVCVLTRQNYCGNYSHCDHQVALAFRRIQWHNNVDCCVGCHIGCLLLRDKNNTNQCYHKVCEGGILQVQTSVVRGTWRYCCFSSPPFWYKGWSWWWLWSQMCLSSCGALGFQDWWQSKSTGFFTLASEYHHFLRLAAWTTWLGIAVVGALCTQ